MSGIDNLELGPGSDATDEAAGFFRYSDGSRGDYLTGGQGLTMIRVRIRVTGAHAPACLGQLTGLSSGSFSRGSDDVPRVTYAQPDGTRVTHNMFIVLDPSYNDAPNVLTTTVGGLTARVMLDQGPDLGIPSAHDLGTSD